MSRLLPLGSKVFVGLALLCHDGFPQLRQARKGYIQQGVNIHGTQVRCEHNAWGCCKGACLRNPYRTLKGGPYNLLIDFIISICPFRFPL